MPDRRLEAPQEGDQQRGEQCGEQRLAGNGRGLDARLREPEQVELLEVKHGDRIAGADDRLALLDIDDDRLDCLAGQLTCVRGFRDIELGVGRHLSGGEIAGQLPLGLRQLVGDVGAHLLLGLGHLVVAHLARHGGVQDGASGFGNLRPAGLRHRHQQRHL